METCNKIPLSSAWKEREEAQTKHRYPEGRCTGPHRQQRNQAHKAGGGCGPAGQIPLKGVLPNRTAHGQAFLAHDSLFLLRHSYLCLVVFQESGIESTAVVKRCPLAFVVIFHHLIYWGFFFR